jgi:large subunit ribosomal protein L17
MRHGNKVKHLGRPADQRKALIRSLVTETLRHGQIRTTKVRFQQQKELEPAIQPGRKGFMSESAHAAVLA